jgi:hypothetical protein
MSDGRRTLHHPAGESDQRLYDGRHPERRGLTVEAFEELL